MSKSDDTISRQAAIDAIINTVSEIGLHDNSEVARYGATFRQHEIIGIIEGMPSAQPEWKRGEWIYKKDLKQFFCDQCGEPSLTDDDRYIYSMDFSNFCPNCGARMEMRGGDEG